MQTTMCTRMIPRLVLWAYFLTDYACWSFDLQPSTRIRRERNFWPQYFTDRSCALRVLSSFMSSSEQGALSNKSEEDCESKRKTSKQTVKRSKKMITTEAKEILSNSQVQKSIQSLFWRVESDEVLWHHKTTTISLENSTNSTNGEIVDSKQHPNIRAVRFVVRGKPLPLSRHRTNRGFVYNPSAKPQAAFRQVVKDILSEFSKNNSDERERNVAEYQKPLFAERERLAMKLVFRMNRPKNHFINNKIGEGRLRESAPKWLVSKKVDVDNLSKFVMDSLNGITYDDDQQVVSLSAIKVYDSDGEFQGATEVSIHSVSDSEMDCFMERFRSF